ncbi:hypothetical protein EUGRSUZ_L00288 [Eucalyptus grandis]|uniref:Uncharacterized protein n=2 Tax=Eucalyptus grandis TaxID=71139 RepID=A0ACC3LCB1_EUCGR|nr:hypothetical protein EUGRSUZ_L00288 [Eucalyptus grandis]
MSWSGGDWLCGACQHQNFKKRRHANDVVIPKALAGDWYCNSMNCGAHNYASRSNCYRCGALKDDYVGSCSGGYGPETGVPPGWKAGDWICNRYGCGVHNYASRTECYKCKTPREYGAAI